MSISINSVVEHTVREVANHVDKSELTTIVTAIESKGGIEAIKEFENAVTIMHETGNVEGLLDYMEELMEEHL